MLFLAQRTTDDPSAAAAAAIMAMSGLIIIIGLAFMVFTILIYFLIVKRTGYSPWLSLLMLVPLANFVLLIILAFSEWPVERENKELRARLAAAGAGGYGGSPPGTTIAPA